MVKRIGKIASIALLAFGIAIASCSLTQTSAPISQAALASKVTAFRSPTCGCCSLWVKHMEEAGFQVEDRVTEDMAAVKARYGVPDGLRSCHTAVIDGYVVEGHIPAADVARLLTETPDVAGIAVPGMPIGSPGMESGNYVEPYTVFSFRQDGTVAAFAEHS